MSLRGRLSRWWREVMLADLKRELPAVVRCQRDVPFIRDANGIVVAVTATPWNTSFTCPRCGMTSYNPEDVRQEYCGNCRDWARPA